MFTSDVIAYFIYVDQFTTVCYWLTELCWKAVVITSVNAGALMLINVLISVLITVEPLILVALNFGVQVH